MAKAPTEPKPKREPKAKKEPLQLVTMGDSLKNYLRLLTVLGPLKDLEEQLKQRVEDEAKARLLAEGHMNKDRPKNFIGTCDKGTAEFQLQKRSKASPLTKSEMEFLAEHKIPVEIAEIKPKSIIINPNVIEDIAIVNAIVQAVQNSPAALDLLEAKGIDCQNIFRHEDAVKKPVVSDESLEAAFKLVDLETMTNVVAFITRFITSPAPSADNDYDEALNVLVETGVSPKKKQLNG
jgi:hypothetical protein